MKLEIGKRIRELRTSKGVSATFVGKNVGLSSSMVSAIELEKCNVTVPQIVALSDFFGVSIDYLVKGAENENSNRVAA